MPYEPYVALAEQLNRLAPGMRPRSRCFSPRVPRQENAVKIARAYTGRPAITAFNGGYHGRTMMTLGLTGKWLPTKLVSDLSCGDIPRPPLSCCTSRHQG